MDLDDLDIFRCVVREGGITRAATRLHRVPSNVTTRIKQFEERLGVPLFRRQGLADPAAMSKAEIYAHHALLHRGDNGRAFLRIMRGFELTQAKQDFLVDGLGRRTYPARIVWGELDPALGLDQMRGVQRVLGVEDPVLLPAKHFLQEDQAAPLSYAIADLVAPLG